MDLILDQTDFSLSPTFERAKSTLPNPYCSVQDAAILHKVLLRSLSRKHSSFGEIQDNSEEEEHEGEEISLGLMALYSPGTLIGRGGFGVVRKAVHRLLNIPVAVKTYKLAFKSDQFLNRVYFEINILEQLSHPNIVQLLEVVEGSQHLHIVMELAESTLLTVLKKNKRLVESLSRNYTIQLLLAVEYLHSQHICHRDITLSNILVVNGGRTIKLADFGTAEYIRSKFKTQSCGTPSYLAPEVIQDSLHLSTAADMWSVGVILYALLCGKLPFRGENTTDLFRRIVVGRYSIPEELSIEARDFIRILLSPDPSLRPSAAESVSHEWIQLKKFFPDSCPEPYSTEIFSEGSEATQSAVAVMSGFGFDNSFIQDCILKKDHNAATAMYRLLLLKYLNSTADSRPTSPQVRNLSLSLPNLEPQRPRYHIRAPMLLNKKRPDTAHQKSPKAGAKITNKNSRRPASAI